MKQILAAIIILGGTSAWAQKKVKASPAPAPSYSSYSGYSNNYKYEANTNLSTGYIRSYKLGDSSFTDINLIASLHYTIQDHIQVGGEAGLTSRPDTLTANKTLVQLMGVFTYNLDSDFKNSMYGDVGVGLAPAYDKTKGNYDSKFSFFFDIGKRFALWDHVAYKPQLRIAKYGDQDVEFALLGLNFALMF